jgi:hypothetical protein
MSANPQLAQRYQSIAAAGVYELGDATDRKIVSTHTLYLKPVGLTGGAIDIMARIKGVDAVLNGDNAGVKVPYAKLWLNGAAGDGSLVTTQITGESLIQIPSTGLVAILSVASISAGSWKVYVWASEGSG